MNRKSNRKRTGCVGKMTSCVKMLIDDHNFLAIGNLNPGFLLSVNLKKARK